MMAMPDLPDDDLPGEIDFSRAVRGKFHSPGMTLNLPIYLDDEVEAQLAQLAQGQGIALAELVNALLRQDLERIQAATRLAA
jgi:hypothetical protein